MAGKDVAQKDINLANEIYVHYNEENYKTYRDKYVKIEIDWKTISKIYKKLARDFSKRVADLKTLINSDNQSLIDVLGINSSLAGGETYSDIEQEILVNLPAQLRQGKGYAMNVAGDIQKLDNFLSFLKNVLNQIDNLSDESKGFLAYLLKQKGRSHRININGMFQNLNIFSFNKTALTSIQSLKKAAEELEKNSGNLKKKNGVFTDSAGNTHNYSNYVFGISQLFVNILGGLRRGRCRSLCRGSN